MSFVANRPKGVYIISESACMNSGTGARRHIDVGYSELKKYFDIHLVLFCKPPAVSRKSLLTSQRPVKPTSIRQFFKWCYILMSNHFNFFMYLSIIRKASPDFIYERSSYLNFNGLIISKLLRIPHMYEINGISADDNAVYYPAICTNISRKLEKFVYQKTFGFYVGAINRELGISPHCSEVIQNGIEKDFVGHFAGRFNVPKDMIEMVFIGHAMKHHRMDVLSDALCLLSNPSSFRLHLVGSNLKEFSGMIPPGIQVVDHGTLTHDEIRDMISKMNVAVVPYAKDYFSHVKLFMYGAAKLAVILPESRNYKRLFSNDEVLFVCNADARQIANKLNELDKDRALISKYGERLYDKVKNDFTWDEIYNKIARTINEKRLKRIGQGPVVYEGSTYP